MFLLSQRISTNCILALFGTRPTSPLSEFACIAPWQKKTKGRNGRGGDPDPHLEVSLGEIDKRLQVLDNMIWLPKITCIWPYESCKGSGQINIYWLNGESRQPCPKMKMFRKKSSHVAPKGGRPSPSGTFSIVWL